MNVKGEVEYYSTPTGKKPPGELEKALKYKADHERRFSK